MDDEASLLPRKLQAALEQVLELRNDIISQDSDSESDEGERPAIPYQGCYHHWLQRCLWWTVSSLCPWDAATVLILPQWVTEAPLCRKYPQHANKHQTRNSVTLNLLRSHTDVRPSNSCYGKRHFILGGILPGGSIIDLLPFTHMIQRPCGWFIILACSI